MNAIDQYIAPAPVRPDAGNARTGSGGADNSGQPFGDVYNQASNNNGSANQRPASSAQSGESDAANSTAATGSDAASGEKNTNTGGAADVVAKFAMEAKKARDAKSADERDGTKASADEKQPTDPSKDAANAKDASAASGAANAAADADGVSAALQLLGAQTTAKTQGKNGKAEPEATGTVGKKDAKDKDEAKAGKEGDETAALDSQAAAAAVLLQANADTNANDGDIANKTGGNGNAAISLDDALGKKADIENTDGEKRTKGDPVTVLDARRFVGTGDNVSSNTKAVLSGVTGDKDWTAAMKAAAAAATDNSAPASSLPVNTLKIQMNPADLGTVTATLRLKGDELTVQLNVQSGEAFKQLSADKDHLMHSLKSQGYSVDQINIQLSPAPADKGVAQSSASGQGQSAGQQMQDGAAGQFAQQGRNQDNNRRQQANGFGDNWQNEDRIAGVDSAGAAGGGTQAGQVYL